MAADELLRRPRYSFVSVTAATRPPCILRAFFAAYCGNGSNHLKHPSGNVPSVPVFPPRCFRPRVPPRISLPVFPLASRWSFWVVGSSPRLGGRVQPEESGFPFGRAAGRQTTKNDRLSHLAGRMA